MQLALCIVEKQGSSLTGLESSGANQRACFSSLKSETGMAKQAVAENLVGRESGVGVSLMDLGRVQ